MTLRWPRALSKVATLVVGFGLLLSALLAVAAWVAHDENEDRLLQQRTKEAAAVLDAAVNAVETPLAEALTLADAVGGTDVAAVERFAEFLVEGERFSSVTVLSTADGSALVRAGSPPAVMDPLSLPAVEPAEASSDDTRTVHVVNLLGESEPRLGYLYRDASSPGTAVYAEQLAPKQRVDPVPPGEAFSGLDYALYLGDAQNESDLLLASTADLPLDGRTALERIPFGDTILLFVASPTTTYGSSLMAALPWLVGFGGAAMTAGAAALVEGLHRRRRDAEALSEVVGALYAREHAIAQTLQQSLLPEALPVIEGLDVAARYVAGAEGTEVGGDWYDVITHDDGRVTVIVGDVVGRGVKAAAVMAGMRYATHTLAALGQPPGELLTTVNGIPGVRGDFATMLCATLDLRKRTMTLALAGHPPPLMLGGGRGRFVAGPVGPPIGFLPGIVYDDVSVAVDSGATLLMCTDGLYERPGEDIDDSLERLRLAAQDHRGDVEGLIDHVYRALVGSHGRDDVAMLAVRVA